MSLEPTNSLIGDWSSSDAGNQPPGGDSRKQGDDQIRSTKGAVRRHFPNFVGTAAAPKTVNASEDEINTLVGVSLTEPIVTLPPGTAMLFYQDAAPPGWTIVAAVDEHSVRLTQGSGLGGQAGGTRGGTNDFSAQFTYHIEGSALAPVDHVLTADESGLVGHTHPQHGHRTLVDWVPVAGNSFSRVDVSNAVSVTATPVYDDGPHAPYNEKTVTPAVAAASASQAHGHALNQDVRWAACIMATKDP